VANNFGFNIGGGSGGIANLVQAPKVTPVRSVQFAPTPQRRQKVTEKDPKDNILAAIVGSLAPAAVDSGLEYLAKKSDFIDNLLYKPDTLTRQEYGVATPMTGAGTSIANINQVKKNTLENTLGGGRPLTDDQYEALEDNAILDKLNIGQYDAGISNPRQVEEARLRRRVERALPSSRAPRQETLFGRGLKSALSYAPAMAFADEDDGSVASYISALGAGSKLDSALDSTRLDNFLKRETERGKALLDVGNFDDVMGNGAVVRAGSNTPVTVRRRMKVSPDKTIQYILSQGDAEVDVVTAADGTQVPVKAGEYYVKPEFVLDTTKLKDPEHIELLVTDEVEPKKSTGQVRYRIDENGQTVGELFVTDYLNNGKLTSVSKMNELYGDVWIRPGPGFGYKEREFGRAANAPKWMEDRDVSSSAVTNSLRPLKVLSKLALKAIGWDPETGTQLEANAVPSLFSVAGGIGPEIKNLQQEVGAVTNFVNTFFKETQGKTTIGFIKQSQQAASQSGKYGSNVNYFSGVIDSQLLYDEAIESGDTAAINSTRREYRQALRRFRDNVADQGGEIGNFAGLDLDNNASWNQTAIERAAILSAQLKLAYASAAQDGSTGVALSDRDVNNYLEQIGFGYKNPFVIIDKVQTAFNSLIGDFDNQLTPRRLARNSVLNTPEAIQDLDIHLRGYGINQRQLEELRDLSKPLKERQALYSDVMEKIDRRTGSLGSTHYVYDPESGRVLFKGIQKIMRNEHASQLEYFENNLLKFNNTSLDEIIEGVDRRYGIGSPSNQGSTDQSSSAPTLGF